jgi:hypothetical protein
MVGHEITESAIKQLNQQAEHLAPGVAITNATDFTAEIMAAIPNKPSALLANANKQRACKAAFFEKRVIVYLLN